MINNKLECWCGVVFDILSEAYSQVISVVWSYIRKNRIKPNQGHTCIYNLTAFVWMWTMSSWVLIWAVNVVERLLAFPSVSFMDLFVRASIYYVVTQASDKENKRNKVTWKSQGWEFGFPLYSQRMLKITCAPIMGKVIPTTSHFEYALRFFTF